MKFTLKELNTLKHTLDVAISEYENQLKNVKVSDDELSIYQIYSRQIAEAKRLIDKIENTEL